eukprot:scaffold3309_cov118-Skeletonema_dohrnii-CCMP3373.AAC.10
MPSQPSSPTEMSYTQLFKRAPLTATPAANQAKPTPKTAPPATINVYDRGRSNATPSTLPSSALFSNPVAMSATRAGSANSNLADASTIEDRLSNLALKLGQQSKSSIDPSNPQPHPSNSNMGEIHQFIDILKNMQNVVSRTVDEQQRTKKARALNTLLTMFESIIDERSNIQQTAKEPSTQHLEWRIKCLETENQRLQSRCTDGETTLQHRNQEITLLQQDVQRIAAENDRLRNDLAHSQDQCQQEYTRAQEAEQVASESEKVANGLLSSYGRLTEENVDLLRAMEDVESEKKLLSKTLTSIREEVDALRNQSNQLHKQLRDSNKQKKELESFLDVANMELEKQRNAISAANEDRQRIQDELHRSQRNSTATSEQLLKLRDEFTKKLQVDRNSKAHESLVTKLEEEQKRRRELEELVSTAKGKEDSAGELMRKLARSNAELRSQVNQMVARINHSPGTLEPLVAVEECSKEAQGSGSLDETKESDNLSCYF